MPESSSTPPTTPVYSDDSGVAALQQFLEGSAEEYAEWQKLLSHQSSRPMRSM